MRRKTIVAALLLNLAFPGFSLAAPTVNDVPKDHWAYPAVKELMRVGIIDGYGDGTFGGNKVVSRYEMAQIIEKAMSNQSKATAIQKALIDKLAIEFALELNKIELRVSKVERKTNVWLGGETRMRYFSNNPGVPGSSKLHGADSFDFRQRIKFWGTIDESKSFTGRLVTSSSNRFGNTDSLFGSNVYLDVMHINMKDTWGLNSVRIGRSALDTVGLGLLGTAANADGITVKKQLGTGELTAWTGNFRSVANAGTVSGNGTQDTNQMTTMQFAYKVDQKSNMRTGYFWSDAADSVAVDGLGARLNTKAGLGYSSSKGWLLSLDRSIGKYTIMADFVSTKLDNVYGGLSSNPKGWLIQFSDTAGPALMYPAVMLVNPTKIGTHGWMIQYRDIAPGTLPSSALVTSSVAYAGQPYNVFLHGYDNVKAWYFAYQRVIANNTVISLEYQDIKVKDRGMTTLNNDRLDKTFMTKIEFLY